VIDVLFLVLPDSLLLDLAGPAEAFRLANQRLHHARKPAAFSLRYVGPLAEVESSVGLGLSKIEPLPAELPARCWVVVLGRPGSAPEVLRRQRPWLAARDWLAPAASVQANRVFVEDGPLLSSAGITAGIDLALHLITRECGPAIASAVAQVMVAFTRRGPQDTQRSPLLAHRDHLHPAVHRVQDAVCAAPGTDWTAQRLAAAAHVTPRHLARLFHTHVRLSPRAYVEHVRRGLAQHALAGGASSADAAQLAGFDSTRQLRQAMHRQGAD